MALVLAVAAIFFLAFWTVFHIPKEVDLGQNDSDKAKLREGLVLDIRAANQYCTALIAIFGVMASIGMNNREALKTTLASLTMWPFAVGFAAATLSILFIPAGYGKGSFNAIRVAWVRTILCEQTAVVFTSVGIWGVIATITH